MKPSRRTFEIDLIPKGTRPIRHFTLSVKKVWGVLLILFFSLSSWFLLIGGWKTLRDLWSDPSVSILERENLKLQGTLDQLRFHSNTMSRQLEQITQQQERVAGLADLSGALPPPPPLHTPADSREALLKAERLQSLSEEGNRWWHHAEKTSEQLPVVPPFRESRLISIPFGIRLDPFTGRRMMHEGVDFPGNVGDTILAPAEGIVGFPSLSGGYGSALRLDHGNGVTTIYTHLERSLVSQGRWVTRGTPIALIGNTGRSSAPHLHYEVRRNGIAVDPILLLFDLTTVSPSTAPQGVSL